MKDPADTTVIVGMSGGVDSSVTALLLKEQGYRVVGVFMKNWEEDDEDAGHCTAQDDYDDVCRVCDQIGIPYYSVNFSEQYWERVFARCLAEYRAGWTPNPDVLCNREIKFNVFFDKALELQGDFLATGHYCQKIPVGDGWGLARGADANKDQSYFLYGINGAVLDRVMFPIGAMPKAQVREIAADRGLATATKRDSTGICFVGKRKFKDLLAQFIQPNPGPFMTSDGRNVGQHDGVAFYTIGQRRGLGIGGEGEAWFVTGKDVDNNVVFVEQGEHHPSLFSTTITATDPSWIGPLPVAPFRCTAKVRYRQEDAPCTVTHVDANSITITFDEPQRAVTPRQAVVLYDGARCLGGATI